MQYKEDFYEAKLRMDAWWDHEIYDRPILAYTYPKPISSGNILIDNWCLARNFSCYKECIDAYELRAPNYIYGGEAIPCYFPNYGPGIMASVLGVEPEFKTETVWFYRETKIDEIVGILEDAKLNQNNFWYDRLVKVTEYAAQKAQGNYEVAMTDLGGILDILASFFRPEKLIVYMKKYPSIIDTCRKIILEKTLKVYDDLQNIVDKYCHGCSAWLNVWCSKRWYPIQCDFSALLSPKWFERFALPDIQAQAEHMDYAIYHLDGPDAIPHLDSLLKLDAITGIQWVPGSGIEPNHHERWMPLYKKIQQAGKNIVTSISQDHLNGMYERLDPKGLFIRTGFVGEIFAEFFLPKWLGGMGGQDEDDD